MSVCCPGCHWTTSVPLMLPWKVHTNVYVPGFIGAVMVAELPGSILTSKPPSLDVTVCASESPFLIVTFAPGATDVGTL